MIGNKLWLILIENKDVIATPINRPRLDYAVITKHWWCVPTLLVLLRLTQKDYELEAQSEF